MALVCRLTFSESNLIQLSELERLVGHMQTLKEWDLSWRAWWWDHP